MRKALLLVLLMASAALGEDHFLTIGGGSSAFNNQISLEKNVLFLQRILADVAPGAPHEILFADGTDAGRDVQFDDPAYKPPRLNVLLSRIFSQRTGELYLQFRSNQIKNVRGSSARSSISQWFSDIGAKLNDEDRLFIYFTGHGGRGNPARNTTLDLWSDSAMAVKEFNGLLAKLPEKVKVVLIMVQCHSGGFADVIFKDASAGEKLTERDVCGFYATVPERPAAGCTPDIYEENYKEYSTYFWAAIYGKSRTGQPVTSADYDNDGSVSFAEAHAYTQIASDTIDIPICTSDAFLRQFSKTKGDELLDMDATYDELIGRAAPAQKAVLEELSKQLKLFGHSRVKAAREGAEKLDKQRKELQSKQSRTQSDLNRIRSDIRRKVRGRWPELATQYHPDATRILKEEGDAVLKLIETHPSFDRFEQLQSRLDDLDTEVTDLDRQWAKFQRYLRTAENIALSANLEKVASEEIRSRYKALLDSESGTLVRGAK